MKNRYFLFIILLSILFGCTKETEFSIQGKITNASGKYIYLDELKLSTSQVVDSVKINKEGEFEFEGHVDFPTFYLLKLSENNFITLLVDTVDNVQVYADAANFSRDYVVVGSEGSELVRDLNKKLTNTKHKLDSLQNLTVIYKSQANYQVLKQKWDEEYSSIVKEQVDYSTQFVREHPFSMASVLALYQKFDENTYVVQDLQSLKTAASALNAVFPYSEHVKALYGNTTKLMREEQSAALRKMIQEQGKNSPDIVLPTPDGKEISLASLQGKFVLLHFWAAVDKTSRIQNEVLVELYKKFGRKNFEIYQVSLDTDRYEWVDAIDKDKLTWINVGDMKGSNQAVINYNVQKVPTNYLLDPEGRIISKDISAPALNKYLGEVL